MNPFFIWLLKSSVSLALLYAVFKLAVSRDKMHTANRFVLLGILFTSVVLPFADVPVFRETQVIPQFEAIHEWVAAPAASEPVIYAEDTPITMSEATPVKTPLNPWLVFYLSVIGLLVGRLAFSVVRVWQIIRRAEKQHFRDVVLAIVKDFIQPFSFLQHIVLSEKDFTENRDMVVAHEYAHIHHKHALDLMICELFTALFWFNPVVWLLRRDLKLIHEYQADQAVLNQGIDAKTYQLLVLKKAVGERRFALANHFSQKPILKRIKMMHMKTNRRRTSLKLALFVPVLALLTFTFSVSNSANGTSFPGVQDLQQSLKEWKSLWNYANLNNIGKVTTIPVSDVNGDYEKSIPIKSDNVLFILINKDKKILIDREYKDRTEVLREIEDFISGNFPDGKKVTWKETKDLPYFGKVQVPMGIISFLCDLDASYFVVQELSEMIGTAYLNVRNKESQAQFNQPFLSLNNEQKKAIEELVPIRISTTVPKMDHQKDEVVFVQ